MASITDYVFLFILLSHFHLNQTMLISFHSGTGSVHFEKYASNCILHVKFVAYVQLQKHLSMEGHPYHKFSTGQ